MDKNFTPEQYQALLQKFAEIKAKDRDYAQQALNKLKGSVDLGEFKKVIPNVTEHIDDIQKAKGFIPAEGIGAVQKLISGKDFINKIANIKAAKELSKMGSKAMPLVGNISSAYLSGDPGMAIPILNEAEALGPKPGTIDYKYERGEQLTPEEREQLNFTQEQQDELKRKQLMKIRNSGEIGNLSNQDKENYER